MPELIDKFTDEQIVSLSSQDRQAILDNSVDGLSLKAKQMIGYKSGKLDMLDAGTSIVGSLLGGAAGSVVPGVGTAVGAVAGGAIGAGIGEFIENKISGSGDGRDVAKAMALSGAIDTATFGLGKVIRFARFGRGADDVATQVRGLINQGAADAGTALSRGQSQAMATANGATLPVSATESAGWVRKVIDQVGGASLFSKGIAEQRSKDLTSAVVKSFDDLVRGAEKYETFEEIGNHFVSALTAGDEAAQAIYGKGLSEIREKIAGVDFSSTPIIDSVKRFLKDNEISAVKNGVSANLSNLSDDIVSHANKIINKAEGVTFHGKGIIEVQQQIRNLISEAYDAQKPTIARQLIQLETAVKEGIEGSLTASGRKEIASEYKLLNQTYREMKDKIFPKFNERLVGNAIKNGDYTAIGKVLSTATGSNAKKVEELMGSLDNSFKIVAKERGESVKWAVEQAEKAKRSARAGFLFHESNQLSGDKIMSKGFVDNLVKTENSAKMQAIFGDEWDQVKKALNFARDAYGQKKGLGGLSLVLNSMQFGTLQGVAAGGLAFGGLEGTNAPGWTEALAVLLAPSVFYKIATRPAAINRLIALDNHLIKNGVMNVKSEYVFSALGKIVSSLPKEDKFEAREMAAELGLGQYF